MKLSKSFWGILWGICGLTLVLELILPHRHSHFAVEGFKTIDAAPGFFAAIGLFGVIFIVIISNKIGQVLQKKEDYYDRPN